MPQLLLSYARQFLSNRSVIDGNEDVFCSAEGYAKAVEAIEVRTGLNVWEVPEGFSPVQTVPSHILKSIYSDFGEEEVFRKARNIPNSR